MTPASWMYLSYLVISVALTVWVARTLYRNGRVFLLDVFEDREGLADSVNHLLVVGFYLINFGYVCLALESEVHPRTVDRLIELLATKVGLVLVVLGGMHFFNLYVFSRIRRGRREWPSRSDRIDRYFEEARNEPAPPPLPES